MKSKILLSVFIIVCFLVLFIKYKDCNDDFSLIEVMNNHLAFRLNLFNSEKAIQKKIIGQKLNLPQNLSSIINNNTILIVKSELANKKSYFDALKFYDNILKEKQNINADIIAVLPTKNVGYLKAFSRDFSNEVKFFADTTFYFSKKLNFRDSENVVVLINNSTTCLYAYLLEIDNPLRDVDEAEIIFNIIKNR